MVRVDGEGTTNEKEAARRLLAVGLTPRPWGNPPGDHYGAHAHGYRKVLYCLAGSITFHTGRGDVEVSAGQRLLLAPGVRHAATVGPHGVRCIEGGG
jgi:quercetin dioxygenase-like cupin family protein